MTFYKMKILTKDKVYEYKVKPIPMYTWDQLIKARDLAIIDLLHENPELLAKATSAMISPDFIKEFYMILDKNRQYTYYYKNHLPGTLYGIQYYTYGLEELFKKPYLLYVEGDNCNPTGDYIKYKHINDEDWHFDKIVSQLKKDNIWNL